jgi:UDP-glucose:(heptosyl)LPS alpha-1,3-glucosyltransferase
MRLGIVIDRLDPAKGGAERALVDLATAMRDAGHDVDVFAMSMSDAVPATLRRVAIPRSPRGARDVAFAERAVADARAAGCDVVLGVRHVTGVDVYWPHGGVHAETLAAVERSKGRVGGSVSRALHAASPKQRALLDLERRFLDAPGAARIWCVSDLVRREILVHRPRLAPNVDLVPNGVDVDAFHPGLRDEHRGRVRREMDVADDVPLLLFLGGASRMKGWAVLRAALATLKDARWVCVAAGARRATSRSSRSGGRVRVLPHQDPRPLYAAADVLVQPTWRDPCSLATLEALACGLTVVTTDANGAAEAFEGLPGAGAVVPTGDAHALAEALSRRLVVARAPNADARRAALSRPRRAWLDGLVASLERAAATSSRASARA